MIKNIVGTVFTRFINALISFIVIIIISQKFGAEGTGTIGLILLGITIIVMINNFVGGSALVYLVPRYDLYRLLVPSYIWALTTSIPVAILLSITKLIPYEFTYHVMLLSLIFSLTFFSSCPISSNTIKLSMKCISSTVTIYFSTP